MNRSVPWHSLLALVLLTLACVPPRRNSVSVDWTTVRQVIDGFGAASNETSFVEPLSETVMDFFYTTKGIGLTLLRIRDYPSVFDCESDSKPGYCVPTTSATLLTSDLKIAQMAVARGASVWSSEWSPPGWMKANGSSMKGGAIIATGANYMALAKILANFVTLTASHGVPIYALSPQNEPDISTWYPSATWTPRQIHDFVPYLHGAFQAANANTKIVIAEQSKWEPRFWIWGHSFSYAAEAMSDPSVAAHVGILAAHNYDQRDPSGPPNVGNITSQHVWETEFCTFDSYDGSMTNALSFAQRIHYFLSAARVNAFHYWYLTAGPTNTDNEALTDLSGQIALRAFAIGNWSKFVRPGWHEVAVANDGPMLVTAFQNPTGDRSAVVVVNRQPFPVADQRFAVGAAIDGSVTPWITSSTHSLTPQPAVPVAYGAFSYAIPERSIVTFAGGSRSEPVR